jgi:predicted TIM-barrel fold metal-dependent hydrolase
MMKTLVSAAAVLLLPVLLCADMLAQPRPPIIDMHLHARRANYLGPDPPPMCTPFDRMPRWDPSHPIATGLTFGDRPPCQTPIPAATTDERVMRETLAVMEKRNIIGMVSGEPGLIATWKTVLTDRMIAGLDLSLGGPSSAAHRRAFSVEDVRRLLTSGGFKVLGEVMAQYDGVAPDDSRLEPYWALAEELDVPVGIHLGPGGPAEFYLGTKGYRARASSALNVEEVLIRHPRLRLYVMHAGYPLVDDLRALLFSHPQVYIDISSIVYTEPRPAFYRFLQQIVEAGYADRVMFGSDQMIWPGIIEPAIRVIEDAPFLSESQKRDIFYNNAARFLRLTPEQIARHHAM